MDTSTGLMTALDILAKAWCAKSDLTYQEAYSAGAAGMVEGLARLERVKTNAAAFVMKYAHFAIKRENDFLYPENSTVCLEDVEIMVKDFSDKVINQLDMQDALAQLTPAESMIVTAVIQGKRIDYVHTSTGISKRTAYRVLDSAKGKLKKFL